MEVLNEDNAILCEPNNLNSWKSAIEYFEIHENRTKIAMKAYNDFILNYTWKARVNKILNEHSE